MLPAASWKLKIKLPLLVNTYVLLPPLFVTVPVSFRLRVAVTS